MVPHVQGCDYIVGYKCDGSDGTMVRSETGLVSTKNTVAGQETLQLQVD